MRMFIQVDGKAVETDDVKLSREAFEMIEEQKFEHVAVRALFAGFDLNVSKWIVDRDAKALPYCVMIVDYERDKVLKRKEFATREEAIKEFAKMRELANDALNVSNDIASALNSMGEFGKMYKDLMGKYDERAKKKRGAKH